MYKNVLCLLTILTSFKKAFVFLGFVVCFGLYRLIHVRIKLLSMYVCVCTSSSFIVYSGILICGNIKVIGVLENNPVLLT